MLLALVYWVAGYWAAGVVIYENKIVIHSFGALFLQNALWGLVGGFILIPIAIIKRLLLQ